MGRKPFLTRADTIAQIRALAELGARDKEIYQALGVSKGAWENALRRAESDATQGKSTGYVRFARALSRARSQGTLSVLSDLRKQSKAGNDRASKVLLELDSDYRPDAPSAGVTITVQTVQALSDAQLRQALRQGTREAIALPDDIEE